MNGRVRLESLLLWPLTHIDLEVISNGCRNNYVFMIVTLSGKFNLMLTF